MRPTENEVNFERLAAWPQLIARKDWRRGSESNRRIKVLQTSPLPLGYRANSWVTVCYHRAIYTANLQFAPCRMSNSLIRRNRLPRKQRGERIETKTTWCLRYYINGKQKSITLAQKGGLYRSWNDVEPPIQKVLAEINE